MEELYAARYNIYWFLSFIVPAIIMLYSASQKKKGILIIGAVVSIISTYCLCNLSVQKKWQTRFEIAKTQEELDYASTDGANLVFTAFIIGPFEALLYTSLWGVVGVRVWPRTRKRKT